MFRSLRNKFVATTALSATALLSACGGGGGDEESGVGALQATVTSEAKQGFSAPVTFYFQFSEALLTPVATIQSLIQITCQPACSGFSLPTGALVAGSNNKYTLTFTPPITANKVTVTLPGTAAGGASVQDLAGNSMVDSVSLAIIGDLSTPQVTVTSPNTVGVFDFDDPCDSCYLVSAFNTSATNTATRMTPTSSEAPGSDGQVVKVVEANNISTLSYAGVSISYTGNNGPQAFDFTSTKKLIRARVLVPASGSPPTTQGVRVLLKLENGEDSSLSVQCDVATGGVVSNCVYPSGFPTATTSRYPTTFNPPAGFCAPIAGDVTGKTHCPNPAFKSVEYQTPTTSTPATAQDSWQTLDFNFGDTNNGNLQVVDYLAKATNSPLVVNLTSGTYIKAVFFFNAGLDGTQAGGSGIYYIDELTLPQ